MYNGSANMPESLRSKLLFEILENGIQLNKFDFDYFKKYLLKPLRLNYLNDKKIRNTYQDNHWDQHIKNVQSDMGRSHSSTSDDKIYRKYLESYYHINHQISDFKEFF